MPERNFLRPARVVGSAGSASYTKEVGFAIGYKQYISALNKGKYVPGVYSCHPVTIIKTSVDAVPGSIPSQMVPGYPVAVSDEGDLIAYVLAGSVGNANSNLPPTWDTNREKFVINKAYTKVISSDLEVGVMLAELRETLEGLRNPLAALRKSFDFYNRNIKKWNNLEELISGYERRGEKYFKRQRMLESIDRLKKRMLDGTPSSVAKALAGTWLEWRYGLRPLISDIQSILELVKSQSRDFSEKLQHRKGKIEWDKSDSGTAQAGLPLGNAYVDWMRQTKSSMTATVTFFLNSPLTFAQKYGMDIFDVPGILWEVVPLSFVVDWFLAVGQWLSALRVCTSQATILGVTVSQRDEITVDAYLNRVVFGSTSMEISSGGSYTYRRDALQRRCFPPGFNVVTPALNPKALDLLHTLDALSLIYQRLPRLK